MSQNAAIDFMTALGRVLRDGPLRDAFKADPNALARHFELNEPDHAAFVQLRHEDLEFQACILIRKRFDLVRRAMPETYRRLGDTALQEFDRHARSYWPPVENPIARDAREFCLRLLRTHPDSLCLAEWNRIRFATSGSHFAMCLLRAIPIGKTHRPGVQILARFRIGTWHEWLLHL